MTEPAERATLEKRIADTEQYLKTSVLFQHNLVCDLPVQAALFWMRKRLTELGDTP